MVLSALLHFVMTSKCVSAHSYSTADILLSYTRCRPYICPISRITALQLSTIWGRAGVGRTAYFQQDLGAQCCTCPTQGPVSRLWYLRAAPHTSLEGSWFKASWSSAPILQIMPMFTY